MQGGSDFRVSFRIDAQVLGVDMAHKIQGQGSVSEQDMLESLGGLQGAAPRGQGGGRYFLLVFE